MDETKSADQILRLPKKTVTLRWELEEQDSDLMLLFSVFLVSKDAWPAVNKYFAISLDNEGLARASLTALKLTLVEKDDPFANIERFLATGRMEEAKFRFVSSTDPEHAKNFNASQPFVCQISDKSRYPIAFNIQQLFDFFIVGWFDEMKILIGNSWFNLTRLPVAHFKDRTLIIE